MKKESVNKEHHDNKSKTLWQPLTSSVTFQSRYQVTYKDATGRNTINP